MNDPTSPAEAAQSAMTAVREGRRDAWLDCFADDARVEDPVEHVPAIVGREALAQFWDVGIASLTSVRSFNYAIDGAGRIASLRAFWDLPAVASALTA